MSNTFWLRVYSGSHHWQMMPKNNAKSSFKRSIACSECIWFKWNENRTNFHNTVILILKTMYDFKLYLSSGHLKNGINGSTENTQCLINQFNTCCVVYYCFCPYFFAGILRNNNYGDHVPAQNQSALMLPLIFKTMLQHTEYLYTYKKVILLLFQLLFPIFSNKSMSSNFHWNQIWLKGSWASSFLL